MDEESDAEKFELPIGLQVVFYASRLMKVGRLPSDNEKSESCADLLTRGSLHPQ